jgi:hypothetical protein
MRISANFKQLFPSAVIKNTPAPFFFFPALFQITPAVIYFFPAVV